MSNIIIYLHGFNSSAESFKSQLLLRHMQKAGLSKNLLIPDLFPEPEAAIKQISSLVETQIKKNNTISGNVNVCFVGSSLGGYYATGFAERYQSSAVLINPSVRPYETLAQYIGENKNYYSTESWTFDRSHIQQLLDFDVENITRPERYMVLLQTGDEVLDYNQAKQKYAQSQLIIEQGGDHSFTGFERYLDQIVSFADV